MKLTETMVDGLRQMNRNTQRFSTTLAYPNENTGKALIKRGLVEVTGTRNGWNHYHLTDAGRTALQEMEARDE